jgi:phosphoenolpyruvate-protein kinase (PTS system EI component)
MIEIPAAALNASAIARRCDFLSIGTNDLIQYTLAMDRDNERLAHLYEPLSPAVLRSIEHTVKSGHAAGRWVGVCGEMAGDPRIAILLTGLGVDELSVSCFDLPRVKGALRAVRFEAAQELARKALELASADAVRALLRTRLDALLPRYLFADGDEA